jgi:hypothetical protein
MSPRRLRCIAAVTSENPEMMKLGFWTKVVLLTVGLAAYLAVVDGIGVMVQQDPAAITAPAASTPTVVEPIVSIAPPPAQPNTYHCQKIDHLITVTGRGDDIAWAQAPWTSDFVDIEGDRKPTPRFRTRAKMLWNEQFLYVYAQLEEPQVWATLTKKNAVIYHDNDFEVFIDPEKSGENYYEYEMNAFNTIWELTLVKRYTRGGPAILGTNLAGLQSAVSIAGTINDPRDTDSGWSAEIAFPFAALASHCRNGACPPNVSDSWRINFSRVEWLVNVVDGKYRKRAGRREDNWVWSPQGLIDMHQPEHWGRLIFE